MLSICVCTRACAWAQLLDVVDTLGLALDSVPSSTLATAQKELVTLHEGVSMTRHTLVKALAGQGVKEVCVCICARVYVCVALVLLLTPDTCLTRHCCDHPSPACLAALQFGAVGDKLDPNLHEVLFEMPHPTLAPGTLAQVMKVGFTIKDRVLRPAKVGVAKKAAPAPAADAETA
jgi:hypothetical protein